MRQVDQRLQQVETQYNAGGDIHLYESSLSLTEQQRKRNRAVMLERVHTTWIEGVLEPSLQGADSIALDLQCKPSFTVTPFWQVLRHFNRTRTLSQDLTPLVQVYDQAVGEVLILGDPGTGKTTLLLELTRDLLKRAAQDERQPMPVVFNLSSWALSCQSLCQWLVSELHLKYQIPLTVAKSWIETDQVLPLLDGLDEVVAVHRVACIEAINAYRRAHGLLPTVVCCRKSDYLAFSMRLLLRTAVVVQPLTEQQIETYLSGKGAEMSMLRQALREDAELQVLASTPLMLNVLAISYQGIPPQERTVTGSLDGKREQIFASYVRCMLNRRGSDLSSMQEQAIRWLVTLARQMKQRGQTVFYIEHIQPDWLPDPRWNWIYDNLAVLLPGMLVGVLMFLLIYPLLFSFSDTSVNIFFFIFLGGLIGGLFSGGQRAKPPEERKEASWRNKWRRLMPLYCGLLVGLGIGWGYGLAYGLTFGVSSALLCFFFGKRKRAGPQMDAPSGVRNNMWLRFVKAEHLRNGLLCLGLFGLSYGLYDSLHSPGSCHLLGHWMPDVLGWGVPDMLACGLIGILLSIILLEGNRNIRPTGVIAWSWRNLWRSLFNRQLLGDGLLAGGIIGLGLGLSSGLASGLHCGGQEYQQGFDLASAFAGFRLLTLTSWLSYSLCYWLLIGVVQGVASNTLEERNLLIPNQGIRNSFHNGLILGLVGVMMSLCVYFLGRNVYVLVGGSPTNTSWFCQVPNSPNWLCQVTSDYPINILFHLLGAGLLLGLLTGGLACLRHMLLRLLLWRAGLIPWNYARFLDAAAECILLRKAGGGYIFLHRLLLDYFAALEPTNLASIGPSQVPQCTSTEPVLSPPIPAGVPVVDHFVGHEINNIPSHFTALNLGGQIYVIEIPGGHPNGTSLLVGPRLIGPGADLAPVSLSFPGDPQQPDLLVEAGGVEMLFHNTGSSYAPAS